MPLLFGLSLAEWVIVSAASAGAAYFIGNAVSETEDSTANLLDSMTNAAIAATVFYVAVKALRK